MADQICFSTLLGRAEVKRPYISTQIGDSSSTIPLPRQGVLIQATSELASALYSHSDMVRKGVDRDGQGYAVCAGESHPVSPRVLEARLTPALEAAHSNSATISVSHCTDSGRRVTYTITLLGTKCHIFFTYDNEQARSETKQAK
jgi:hypothetical protein